MYVYVARSLVLRMLIAGGMLRSDGNEDIPSECLKCGRDMREHTQEGLEGGIWDWSYFDHHQMSLDLPQPRVGT